MRDREMRQIIKYIENNLNNDISLTEIAKEVNYSPYYCSACFRECTGNSIRNYILKKRLQHAVNDLYNTDLRILDIACRYGYSSQEAFTRAFTKIYGISPQECRRKKHPTGQYYTKYDSAYNNIEKGESGMKDEVIMKLQDDIEKRGSSKGLHILNGSYMLEEFKRNGRMREGFTYISFNEAMCWGEADEILFGDVFIKNRVDVFIKNTVDSLKGTEEGYRDIVLKPLEPLFNEEFDMIVLWFGDDMFCQMNMITIMAYLEQINYTGDILLCLEYESIDEMLPEAFEVRVEGSLEVYKSIICRHEMPSQKLLPVTYQATELYLNYRSKISPIKKYISQNIHKEKVILVRELLEKFTQYGLGDLQYETMIKELLNK